MSVESAKAFIEKVKSDEEFAKKVMECKDADGRLALSKDAGFDFTTEEITEVGSELDDGELDAVAGAGSCRCTSWLHEGNVI